MLVDTDTDVSRPRARRQFSELPAYCTPPGTHERVPLFAGHGACKSCDDCRGYIPLKPNYCKCGHHFSQHA